LLNRNEDSQKAIEKAKKIIQSPVLENYPKCVATFYVNVLHSYIFNGVIEPFFPTLKKAQLLLDRHPTLISNYQHIIYTRELEFYINVIKEKPKSCFFK